MKQILFGVGTLLVALAVTARAGAQQPTRTPDRPNPKAAGAQKKPGRAPARPKARGGTTVWRIVTLINDGKNDSAAARNVPVAFDGNHFALVIGRRSSRGRTSSTGARSSRSSTRSAKADAARASGSRASTG
jgi:hypothetical protein